MDSANPNGRPVLPRTRTARAILEASIESVYQRAIHAHSLVNETVGDSGMQGRLQPPDVDSDELGPMAELARTLDLDELQRDLVWNIVACSYDPRITPHLEAVAGPSGRRGLSVSAYVDLIELDNSRGLDLARWLDTRSNALVSTGLLLAAEPASPAERAYVASSRLVSFLCGEAAPEAPVRLVRADRALLYDDPQSAAIGQISQRSGGVLIR